MYRHRVVPRLAFSLLELMVVLALVAVSIALTAAAVQRARSAADRAACSNRLRQLALGLIQFHDAQSHLPQGMSYAAGKDPMLYLAWPARITPYLERIDLWSQAEAAFKRQPDFHFPPHPVGVHVAAFVCPSDPRSSASGRIQEWGDWQVGLLSYLGNEGIDQFKFGGVLFVDSRVRFVEVTDGLGMTLLLGERPPSPDMHLGWWYAGTGQNYEGSGDSVLGVREIFHAVYHRGCDRGPHHFRNGSLTEECDYLHFWSLHPGGANFGYCDGSVRFLTYAADPITPALATRAGGETVQIPD